MTKYFPDFKLKVVIDYLSGFDGWYVVSATKREGENNIANIDVKPTAMIR